MTICSHRDRLREIFARPLVRFCLLYLMLVCAFANYGSEQYWPTLTLTWEDDQLVLRPLLTPDQEVATIFETSDVSIPPRAWIPLRTFPAANGLESSIILRDWTASSRFFRIEKRPIPLPNTMAWISPGAFTMGSPESEPGRYFDEGPQHPVDIPQGFWLGRFEVTQAEYETLMKQNPSSTIRDPSCPVESVTWDMATQYCARLTDKERLADRLPPGYIYRLPTSTEWEYACRAGTQTRYSFGDGQSELSQHAWWANNGGPAPHPVGQKLPNPWGLYDMHGNVFEWCLDEYEAYPEGRITPGKTRRVVRSGAFYCPAYVLRSACRFESTVPTSVSRLVGFRVALAPVEPMVELQPPAQSSDPR